MKQVASLRYEVIFKKAFCQPDIFTAFVKDVTGVAIEIDEVETEKRFDPPIGRVESRFDLYAEDRKNRVIVDIQHVRFPDHYDRFLYYHCAAILEQVASAKNHEPIQQVLTLVVLTSGDRHGVDLATIDFDPKDRAGNPLHEIPHRVFYLCPPYANADTPEPYREWLLAIQDSLDEQIDETAYHNQLIQKVFATIARDTLTPQERARMKDEYGYEQIGQDQFAKGQEQGKAEGKTEGKQETALAMLQEGLDPTLIAKVTGLPVAMIAELANLPRAAQDG